MMMKEVLAALQEWHSATQGEVESAMRLAEILVAEDDGLNPKTPLPIVTELDSSQPSEFSDMHALISELRMVTDCPALRKLAIGLHYLHAVYDRRSLLKSLT